MAKRTAQDYFYALSIAGVVYLFMYLIDRAGFFGWMVAAYAFQWALRGEKDEHAEEAESMIRPPRKWREFTGTGEKLKAQTEPSDASRRSLRTGALNDGRS